MGKLLDIARVVPAVETPPERQAGDQNNQLDHKAYRTEGGRGGAVSGGSVVSRAATWSQPAADLLDVLVKADAPMLHSALVAVLAARGHGKAAARGAIAAAQREGWIEHNLTTGYVLGGETDTP